MDPRRPSGSLRVAAANQTIQHIFCEGRHRTGWLRSRAVFVFGAKKSCLGRPGPAPHCPHSPLPKANTSPAEVRASVCSRPQETLTASSTPATGVGKRMLLSNTWRSALRMPWPSSPGISRPHGETYSVPQMWRRPANTTAPCEWLMDSFGTDASEARRSSKRSFWIHEVKPFGSSGWAWPSGTSGWARRWRSACSTARVQSLLERLG